MKATTETPCRVVYQLHNEALVQCCSCSHNENREYGRYENPSELTCTLCGGHVEVLTINGVPQR